jgi:hypothetical protein
MLVVSETMAHVQRARGLAERKLLFGVASVVPKDTGETEMQLVGKKCPVFGLGIETNQQKGEADGRG